jgi:hypothetical protein
MRRGLSTRQTGGLPITVRSPQSPSAVKQTISFNRRATNVPFWCIKKWIRYEVLRTPVFALAHKRSKLAAQDLTQIKLSFSISFTLFWLSFP